MLKISRSQIDQVLNSLSAPSPATAGKPRLHAVGGTKDQVAMSRDAERIRDICKMIADMPEVRPERLAELVASVDRGEYNPSALDVAEKMLGRLIADKLK